MTRISMVAALSRMVLAIIAILTFASASQAQTPPAATPAPSADPKDDMCVSQETFDKCEEDKTACMERKAVLEAKCGDQVPKQAASGDKPQKKHFVPAVQRLICVTPGATLKRLPSGKQYCECSGGVPAELVDKESPAYDPTITKGQCVVAYDEFQTEIAKLQEAHRKTCTSPDVTQNDSFLDRCEKTGKDIHEIIVWYRSLIGAKFPNGTPIPLNQQTWVELNLRMTAVQTDIDAITNVYCPLTDKCKPDDMACRCRVHEETFCKEDGTNCPDSMFSPVDVDLGPRVLAAVRFGAPSTIAVTGELGLTWWWGKRDGLRGNVGVGPAWNEWSKRLAVPFGVSYVHAFDDKRAYRLHLGVMGVIEPNDTMNDASTAAAQIGFRFVPGGGNFFIDPAIAAGVGKSFIYDNGVRTGPLSNWAFVLVPSLSLGLTFH